MTRQLYDDDRVRRILNAADIDILVACRPENFSYISGVTRMMEHRFEREHTTFALLTRDAYPALIVPYFEFETVREETSVTDLVPFRQSTGVSVDAATGSILEGSHEAELASKISELGFQNSRIGYDEKYTPVSVYELIRKHLPDAQLIAATDVFNRLRQVKTGEEIHRLTRSSQIVEKAYKAMWAAVAEGVTERQLAAVAYEVFLHEGAPPLGFMVCGAGVRTAIEHLTPSDCAVHNGELIRFDMGVRYQGYQSDVGRTFACGNPSSEQTAIYATMFDAYQQVIEAMKPGVEGRELYEIYRRGMGDYYKVTPMNWVGHSLGQEIHESPYLGPHMNEPLEPGMVFAVEIVLGFPGREGYHVEDPILITEKGNRRLIDLPNESLIVGNYS